MTVPSKHRHNMKKILFYLIIVGVFSFPLQPAQADNADVKVTTTKTPSGMKITNVEAVGNLAATHKLGCMPLKSVTPEFTPADLHQGVVDCIKKADYKNAAALYQAAGTFATFDMQRVTDKTAHQARTMLSIKTGSTLSAKDREQFSSYTKAHIPKKPDRAFCESIRKVGPPTYYPHYMIQHGMSAITGNTLEPIVKDFNADNAWLTALDTYLHCKF
ncbi:MAG: hypothetical protein OXT65_06770 [Alphaproteobacteria bacterium]|nr:hypothetical protein [Alphaproteobacteria bacterium]